MNTQQWLAHLIQFESISSNTNKPLIQVIDTWFKSHHIASQIIPGPTDEKVNLFATIPAHDGSITGGLVLSGHTDVVPVAGQMWNTDPFIAVEQEGKIYGRGACDMKGFIAVVLALVPEFKKLKLSKPIHFSFTCDEEIGCIGVEYLVSYLQEQGIQPEGCLIGEPTGMRPIVGEKGRRVYHAQVQGKAVHSSLAAEGCNAIEYASRLICYIKTLADYVRENGPFDNEFDVPFTTITTNIISGGIATNIVPGACEFIVELRYNSEFLSENFRSQVEHYIQQELVPEMRKTYTEAAIYFDMSSDVPVFNATEDSLLIQILRAVTGIKERYKVSYATEAGAFHEAHIPTVICGPGYIQQAHRPNEFISIEQLDLCEKVLRNVIHFFCMKQK